MLPFIHFIFPLHLNLCVGGCGNIETAVHLFIGCEVFGTIWYLVCHWLDISVVFPGSITDHFFQFIHMVGMSRASHLRLKVIWLACVWVLWKERNNRIFKNVVADSSIILDKLKLDSFLWLSSNHVPLTFCYHDWW